MVKISDVELPVVFKDRLLFKAGNWNGWNIKSFEVDKSPQNTSWNKINSSLIFSHQDNKAELWAGNVKNIKSSNGKVYGDIEVWDADTALKLKYGEAPMAISAGIAWPKQYAEPTNFFFRNFSLVSDPGVQDKEIFLNFQNEGISGEYNIASFSSIIEPNLAQFEKDKVCMDKKEFVEEHEKLVDVLKSGSKEEQEKEADDQSKELDEKKADMSIENQMKESVLEKKEYQSKDVAGTAYGSAIMAKDMLARKENSATPASDVKEGDFEKEESEEEKKEDDENKEENFEGEMTMSSTQGTPLQQGTNTMKVGDTMGKKKKGDKDDQETPAIRNYCADQTNSAERGFNIEEDNKMQSDKKNANFDNEVPAVEAPVAEKPSEAKPVEAPKQSEAPKEIQTANPVSQINVDEMASKLADKLIPQLKPKSMTTHEFGGSAMDPQENAIERLAQKMSIRN
jgi:hypothetical protein